ncbi:unnamed protein product [Arabidopsis thaliana]|uniref:Uncharacterized protein n=1 Tax=Arabidopsis thaliana TaxID=3702 RepID=A0A5S9XQS6_ARATH|nr:unnamed protein product [Arabidopsis thaliana]
MGFKFAPHDESSMNVSHKSVAVSAHVISLHQNSFFDNLLHKLPVARTDDANKKILCLATLLEDRLMKSAKSLEDYSNSVDIENRVEILLIQLRKIYYERRAASTPSSVGVN